MNQSDIRGLLCEQSSADMDILRQGLMLSTVASSVSAAHVSHRVVACSLIVPAPQVVLLITDDLVNGSF